MLAFMLSILLPAIALFREFKATSKLAFSEDERELAFAISTISTSAIKLSADVFNPIKSKESSSGFLFCGSSFSDAPKQLPSRSFEFSSSSTSSLLFVFSSLLVSSSSLSLLLPVPPPVPPVLPPVPPVPPLEPEFRVVLKKT